jgi:FkbM family methyltransferase
MSFSGFLSASAITCAGWCLSSVSFKGYWRAARLLGSLASPEERRAVRIGQQGKFWVYLRDPYWSRLLFRGYRYEPEIERMLQQVAQCEQIAFLDCGANFGYWSIRSRELFPAATVIAIEAEPSNFDKLAANLDLNGGGFISINAAVYDTTGETVSIGTSNGHHADAQVGRGTALVGTVTIDDLIATHCPDARTIVVKIDVEGSEEKALDGALDAISNRTCVFIYEDHGQDTYSIATRHALRLGMEIYFVNDDLEFVQIMSPEQASALKIDKKRGYNFVAVRNLSPPLFGAGNE